MENEKEYNYDVFISYTNEDGSFAANLASALDSAGVNCFLAEKDISLSKDWLDTIHGAILSSRRILFILTPRSKDSLWVNAEAGAAWILNKEMIPAFMSVEPKDLIDIIRMSHGCRIETPEQVQALVDKLAPKSQKRVQVDSEHFTDNWKDLLKIGAWEIDENSKLISGEGMYNYLLSQQEYKPPYTINTTIRFGKKGSGNSGLVLGWSAPNNIRRYYHLLFSTRRVLLELIGNDGGDEFGDYKHVDAGVDFIAEAGRSYSLSISVEPDKLKVIIDDETEYTVNLTESLSGRVGLRPWRSVVKCNHFYVQQK
ncbi:toll/interleukin-1 receptor domain-containing protein [Candidatus Uabimicrobium sp. HlEnr_7]|uniref:toll/interleukin-1 receptor domain-containing protein n=1 Tax=Candidatus Uabimicrobium helgolandensis TaxID=3095367 RepID=UPI0035566308